jgi:hypothetical protein
MRRFRIRLRRRFRRGPDAPAAALATGRTGLGEPSAPGAADDAELDALRGELVRELDRMASARPPTARS